MPGFTEIPATFQKRLTESLALGEVRLRLSATLAGGWAVRIWFLVWLGLSSGRMKRIRWLMLCWALAAPMTGLRAAQANLAAPSEGERVWVGVSYFAGWWEALPNKWHGKGWTTNEPDWRREFPGRVPLLGSYNDQPTLDREIAAAAGHGVDFFSILWYFPRPGSREEAQAKLLNRGLEHFLKSTNGGLMRFMIEYCNAAGFDAATEADWSACVRTWLAAMRHPSYLRVDGRLVFKVHGADQFLISHERDLERCQRRLRHLREAARAAGLGEMVIGGGIMSRSQLNAAHPFAKLFDFTATYMSIPEVEIRAAEHPYAALAAEARTARALHAEDPVPWVPYVAAGWHPRPWTHRNAEPHHRRFFTFPSRAEWAAELRSVKEDFKKYPRLGLPRAGGGRQPAFTIYAWNEFGEGGIAAPTRGEGYMKLESVRELYPPPPTPTPPLPSRN